MDKINFKRYKHLKQCIPICKFRRDVLQLDRWSALGRPSGDEKLNTKIRTKPTALRFRLPEYKLNSYGRLHMKGLILPKLLVLLFLLVALAAGIHAETIHDELLDAAYNGDTETALELLRQGASVYKGDTRYGHWARAITLATENNHTEMVAILLAYGANDFNGISTAIRNGNIAIVWMFLAAGAEVTHNPSMFREGPPICDAVETNNFEIVKLLVDHGSPVNFEGSWRGERVTLRQLADRTGNTELVAYLKSQGMR